MMMRSTKVGEATTHVRVSERLESRSVRVSKRDQNKNHNNRLGFHRIKVSLEVVCNWIVILLFFTLQLLESTINTRSSLFLLGLFFFCLLVDNTKLKIKNKKQKNNKKIKYKRDNRDKNSTFTALEASRLSNGLRVITCDDRTGVVGLGLFTLNGAKFEDAASSGAAAVFESLPLRSNQLMTTPEISQTLGVLGNAIRVVNNKEALGVLLMVPGYHRREGLELLNAMVLHPTQDPDEFAVAKAKAAERTTMATRDGMSMCLEMLHEAGWNGKGLGNPLNPSEECLERLSLGAFTSFYAQHTTPERSVIAATGVEDHEGFVKDVEETLQYDFILKAGSGKKEEEVSSSSSTGGMSSSGSSSSSLDSSSERASSLSSSGPLLGLVPTAPYTGGLRSVENTDAPESLNKFQEKNLSHIALFFKGVPLAHPDYYTISVMQTLLGGGSSFSSGGPGKGMHTKIYREVLTREAAVHSMECITAWYSDGGLIGFYGSASHEHADRLLLVMLHQCATIPDRISDHHLQMAKNQMLSQLIVLGETREQLLSDMGLNLLVHNYMITPKETAEGASTVTMESLRRVSREILDSPPALAVYGATKTIPTYEQLQAMIRSKKPTA
eukprot:gene10569-7339_t